MKQCELSEVEWTDSNILKRTGMKKFCFIDIDPSIKEGTVIDLKKIFGLWVIDKIYGENIERHLINHAWHVGGL